MADLSQVLRRESAGLSFIETGAGAAVPLVMLHGIGSNAQSFAALMQALPAGRRLLAWDAPGYGASLPLSGDWPAAADYAAALCSLLDRLDLQRIVLMGHSLGALVAGSFATLHPDRLDALVLASPALGYGTRAGEALAKPAADRLDAMIAEGAAAFAAARAPRLVADPARQPGVAADVLAAMSQVKLPGYAHASRMLSCADLLADARRISTPTLVLVGDRDVITPPPNCRRLYDVLTDTTPPLGHRFELISGCGHAVLQENAPAVATLVSDFALSR